MSSIYQYIPNSYLYFPQKYSGLEYNAHMINVSLISMVNLFIGFSVFYALVLILNHFNKENRQFRIDTHNMGIVLLLSLIGIQLFHYDFLQERMEIINHSLYLFMLYLIAPSFYFYARPMLKAQSNFGLVQSLHFAPAFLAFVLPSKWLFSAAFVVGSGYLLWLLKTIYALRVHRKKFKPEVILLSLVFIIAVAVSVLALSMPISNNLFFSLYASAVGFGLFMVALIISFTPRITENISQAARETYAVTTLSSVDCDMKLSELNALMQLDKLYQQSNLDLMAIATELKLSAHQLSELINSRLKMSFSQYLREQRVQAAKIILIDQPKASVLSIGMEVGFSSQSNFYEAFKEISGKTPGQFRKASSQ